MSHEVHFTCDVCGVKAPASEATTRWRRAEVRVWPVGKSDASDARAEESDVCSANCMAELGKKTMQVDLLPGLR